MQPPCAGAGRGQQVFRVCLLLPPSSQCGQRCLQDDVAALLAALLFVGATASASMKFIAFLLAVLPRFKGTAALAQASPALVRMLEASPCFLAKTCISKITA